MTGAGPATIDAVDSIDDLFPTAIGITLVVLFVVSAVFFRSLVVPIRQLITIALPITWVYGLAVLVFDNGILNWMIPSLKTFGAIYWLTPVMVRAGRALRRCGASCAGRALRRCGASCAGRALRLFYVLCWLFVVTQLLSSFLSFFAVSRVAERISAGWFGT